MRQALETVDTDRGAAQPLSRALGVHGWEAIDPLLLAALATQLPVLLVGPHGTAKSLLVERLAAALDCTFRHYNASLLNYDDLVGIPLPEDDGQRLRFVATPAAIWDAEFAFFDEISRCRADLQNKLFPLIHERRVCGIRLDRLQHRWAAMNPPWSDDAELLGSPDVPTYLGSEPLDAALADRFAFVIRVPAWQQLSRADRLALVTASPDDGAERPACDVHALVAETARRIPALDTLLRERLAEYVVTLVDLLERAGVPLSPRRAHMLRRGVVATHAARLVLEGPDADLARSAELALASGLPQNATSTPPSPATLTAAHLQAWEVVRLDPDDVRRIVLAEPDPVRRIVLADRLDRPDAELSHLVTQALSVEASDARRMGVATALFLAFRDRRNLAPAAWEALALLARRVLEPRAAGAEVGPGPALEAWREVNAWLASRPSLGAERDRLERNYLLAGFPDLWVDEPWRDALDRFRADLDVFGVAEVAA